MNEKYFIGFLTKIAFLYICYKHNVLSLKIQTKMQNQLRMENTLKTESTSEAKFVDSLLLGRWYEFYQSIMTVYCIIDVLKMLMSSKKGNIC
jgi:hypothetical protein